MRKYDILRQQITEMKRADGIKCSQKTNKKTLQQNKAKLFYFYPKFSASWPESSVWMPLADDDDADSRRMALTVNCTLFLKTSWCCRWLHNSFPVRSNLWSGMLCFIFAVAAATAAACVEIMTRTFRAHKIPTIGCSMLLDNRAEHGPISYRRAVVD